MCLRRVSVDNWTRVFSRHQPALISVKLMHLRHHQLECCPGSQGLLPRIPRLTANYEVCQMRIGKEWSVSNLRARHAVMGEEEPETEDWHCEHIKDSIGDNLSVDISEASAINDPPNDWVQCP